MICPVSKKEPWRILINRYIPKGINQSFNIKFLSSTDGPGLKVFYIWVKSPNCGCLVTWFYYQLIAKPGNKTATVPWLDPHIPKVSTYSNLTSTSLKYNRTHCILSFAAVNNLEKLYFFKEASGLKIQWSILQSWVSYRASVSRTLETLPWHQGSILTSKIIGNLTICLTACSG